jgi:hypothetical protein
MCGGFVLGDSKAHTLSHSAVSDPSLSPWVQNLVRKTAQHLAVTSIKSTTPSSVRRCKVDTGTLKIAPRHIYTRILPLEVVTRVPLRPGKFVLCAISWTVKKVCTY